MWLQALLAVLCVCVQVTWASTCRQTNTCVFCTSCKNCWPGSYHSTDGIDKCHSCPGDQYQPNDYWTGSCYWKTDCSPNYYLTSSGSSTANRACAACPAGKQSSGGLATTCDNVNGCTTYGGNVKCKEGNDESATCHDATGNDPGFTCTCSTGYSVTKTGCVNTDGCTGNAASCSAKGDSSATCVDAPPPSTGYTCECSAGYKDAGGVCKDINGCLTASDFTECALLGDRSAVCHDVTAPGLGNTCTCSAGYESQLKAAPSMQCKDINGCAESPCVAKTDKNATCEDIKAPLTGFMCHCSTGYSAAALSACTNTDGCAGAANTCDDRGDLTAQCVDTPAPGTGHSCKCSAGRHDMMGFCIDTNGCAGDLNTCGQKGDSVAVCIDAVAPATGFECNCTRAYENIAGVCTLIDTCKEGKCNSEGDNGAICSSLVPPAIGSTCDCTAGFEEICSKDINATIAEKNDKLCQCVDINGCAKNPCIQEKDIAASCTDVPAPGTGHSCTCTAGYASTGSSAMTKGAVAPAAMTEGTDAATATTEGTDAATATTEGTDATAATTEGTDAAAATTEGADAAAATTKGTDAATGTAAARFRSASVLMSRKKKLSQGALSAKAFLRRSVDAAAKKQAAAGGGAAEDESQEPSSESGGTCKDINGCKGQPCQASGDKQATCTDAPAPQGGKAHTCTCSSGYHSQRGVCVNINSCADADGKDGGTKKCTSDGDNKAKCDDFKPPRDGFSCDCTVGFSQQGDKCSNIDGCENKPCEAEGDTTSTCMDIAAPGVGNKCECSAGYQSNPNAWKNGKQCMNINSCLDNDQCTSDGDAKAECQDQPPPSTTFHCTCSKNFYYNKATQSCQKNLCLVPVIINGGYITHGCEDGACPMMTNGQALEPEKVVCDEGFTKIVKKLSKVLTCQCLTHGTSCTTISDWCQGAPVVSVKIPFSASMQQAVY